MRAWTSSSIFACNESEIVTSFAYKFKTSVFVALISLFKFVVRVWMSESFPATAVAKESARSFNKPSAAIARDTSSSILLCNKLSAACICASVTRWSDAVAVEAETLPSTKTLPSTERPSIVVAPSTFKPSNSVFPSTSRVPVTAAAPSKVIAGASM